MLFEPEDPAVISPDALEDAIAVKQSMIEHRDLGVLFVAKFSVDINFQAHNDGQATESTSRPQLRSFVLQRSEQVDLGRASDLSANGELGPPRPCLQLPTLALDFLALHRRVEGMETNWAVEHLQVIRTLMERSAVYRRALAPVMVLTGAVRTVAALAGCLARIESPRAFFVYWLLVGLAALVGALLLVRRQALREGEPFWSPPTR